MTGLFAYLVLVVVIPALLLGHQGQDFPLRRACAWLYGRLPASGASQAVPEGREPQRPSRARTARPVPSWAHSQPIDYEEAA